MDLHRKTLRALNRPKAARTGLLQITPGPSHSSAVCESRAAIQPMEVDAPVADLGSSTSAVTVTSAQSMAPIMVYGAVSAVSANQPMGICGVCCRRTPPTTS